LPINGAKGPVKNSCDSTAVSPSLVTLAIALGAWRWGYGNGRDAASYSRLIGYDAYACRALANVRHAAAVRAATRERGRLRFARDDRAGMPVMRDTITIEDVGTKPFLIHSIAALLVAGFREHWPDAWPTLDDAIVEVEASLEPGHISRVAIEDGEPLGWIGGMHDYDRVWELHPLVVREDRRNRGIGRILVEDLERLVAAEQGLTLRLGTNDDDAMTSVGGGDLYPNPLDHLAALTDRKGHPFGFYRRLGFVVTGIIPDADGLGKPDILMAKRVAGAFLR